LLFLTSTRRLGSSSLRRRRLLRGRSNRGTLRKWLRSLGYTSLSQQRTDCGGEEESICLLGRESEVLVAKEIAELEEEEGEEIEQEVQRLQEVKHSKERSGSPSN